ncbi:hypothetical protein BX600DRAFT_516832 [Xylariales sp. PMI_506]|nr:hypothetical protein BX600DRAFT_516832 [Xylariales sp. PMI_506]
MPYYQFHHVAPLSKAQKDKLAQAITQIHCNKFKTAFTIYVNVRFTNTQGEDIYVGGIPHQSNIIHGTLRDGPLRTRDDYQSLCLEISSAWTSIVHPDHSGRVPAALALHGIFLTGADLAIMELGLIVPTAGKEKEWALENMPNLKKRAQDGDEAVATMLAEMQTKLGIAV